MRKKPTFAFWNFPGNEITSKGGKKSWGQRDRCPLMYSATLDIRTCKVDTWSYPYREGGGGWRGPRVSHVRWGSWKKDFRAWLSLHGCFRGCFHPSFMLHSTPARYQKLDGYMWTTFRSFYPFLGFRIFFYIKKNWLQTLMILVS